MSLLDCEIKWITENQHLYSSPIHARSVIGNITKRYEIMALKKEIQRVKGERNEA